MKIIRFAFKRTQLFKYFSEEIMYFWWQLCRVHHIHILLWQYQKTFNILNKL
jgi:hypothetical protein